MIEPLCRINMTISQELLDAIDFARGKEGRNAFIERILRRYGPIRDAARKNGITFIPRRRAGRYPGIEIK